MRHTSALWLSLVTLGLPTCVLANEDMSSNKHQEVIDTAEKRLEIKKLIANNAEALQDEAIKDPFQSFNRSIYQFNDTIDRYVARPLAIQYQAKVPNEVRGSYRQFRKNLAEPWNALNQLVQGKPLQASKTLGRFSINTLTSLGFADPATRLGLEAEEESLSTTLGYYGVPSGPYLMLPFLGPSTLRDSLSLIPESQVRWQEYMLEDHQGAYWGDFTLGVLDTRAQLLSLEGALQGDKYAFLRDAYLQRQNAIILKKQGKDEVFEELEFDEE